jgi:hypothetical protein
VSANNAMTEPDINQVFFYEKPDYDGTSHTYKEGDDKTFTYPEHLNDLYRSVKVGAAVKVLAWQHSDGSGIHKVWETSQPNISSIGGLSKFKVLPKATRILVYRFENRTGNGQRYCAYIDAAGVSTEKIESCSGDSAYKLVGMMPEGGPPVTTAIYVRDMQTNQYLPVASLHFQWNSSTHEVDIVESDNFPDWLGHERAAGNKYTIFLKRVPTA